MKTSELSCEICGDRGGPLYRANPKGELPMRMRCEACLDKPPTQDLKKLCDAIAPSRAEREGERD